MSQQKTMEKKTVAHKTMARQFRDLMEQPGIISTLGAHDVLSAVLAEQAGFDTVFIGGFGTSASLFGLPDINFVGMSEMVDATRRMVHRLSIPVVAAGGFGFGEDGGGMLRLRFFFEFSEHITMVTTGVLLQLISTPS